jgi:hypothetical protein
MSGHYRVACYSTEVLLFFNTILEYIDEVFWHWNEFKNSGMVEIELLHLQLFMTKHFQILVNNQPDALFHVFIY